jgi:hypothetical protein
MGLPNYPEDFCTYTRGVLKGLTATIVVGLVFLVAAACLDLTLGELLGWAAACVLNWEWITPLGPAVVVMVLCGVLLSFVLVVKIRAGIRWAKQWYTNAHPKTLQPEKYPSFFVLLYRKIKDKTCFKINITREE